MFMKPEAQRPSQAADQLSIEEKMLLWIRRNGETDLRAEDPPEDAADYLQENGENDEVSIEAKIPDLDKARAFLFKSQAYERLQKSIRTRSNLTSRKGQNIQIIRDKILSYLAFYEEQAKDKQTKIRPPSASFQIAWNPISFLTQQYKDGSRQEIDKIITLTGSAVDAQATTVGYYIRQVWPEIGIQVLRTVQAVIVQPEHPATRKCHFYFLFSLY
jgi:hypothetical protein